MGVEAKCLCVGALVALMLASAGLGLVEAAARPEEDVLPVPVHKTLQVDQAAQMMYVFENAQLVRTIPVSTGIDVYHTPAFEGQVGHYVASFYGYGSLVDHAWYITRVAGNIYIHGAPYTLREGQKDYEDLDLLGVKPSSHGCIRIHPLDAEWLSQWNPVGIPITITAPLLGHDWGERHSKSTEFSGGTSLHDSRRIFSFE